MYTPQGLTFSICCLFFIFSFNTIAQVGIGTTSPDDDLDVVGNTQVSGYLRVGDPVVPQTVTTNSTNLLYSAGGSDFFNDFYTTGGCGAADWYVFSSVYSEAYLEFYSTGNRGRRYSYSPSIWIPSNATSAYIELVLAFYLNNNDGVFLEYSTNNGSNWNALSAGNFVQGVYTGNITGSNNNCNGNGASTAAWTGNASSGYFSIIEIPVSGTWLQLRFTGTENNAGGGGYYFDIFNLNVISNSAGTSTGGAFAAGNIYSENNIYAGSNVMLGDLAEYFPVVGHAEKGDIIAYTSGKRDVFSVSTKENDDKVIGIYSSNPTLTLNNPNSGLPVALQGRVPVNVVGEPIKKGDYLMASYVSGKAMKATKSGFVIGRALESFNGGKGQIICLVETGWKNLNTNQHQTSNTSVFPIGVNKLTIKDKAVNVNSKIFITFLGNIGSHHWVDSVKNGSFDLNLANNAPRDVRFDYLIESATNSQELIDFQSMSSETVMLSNSKDQNQNRNATNAEANKKQLRAMDDSVIPPSVPDPEKGYVWTSNNGLKESASLKAEN